MKIKDILQRDPSKCPLVNNGQARIVDSMDERSSEELKGELSTFVCEGQFEDGILKIIRSFIDNLNRTSQRGSWVSGFFGSGKSHLLKMLCHLWQDTVLPGGASARSLVPALSSEMVALLRELDIAGKRAGGLLAAAGSLPSGSTEHVRLNILSVLLRACGLPSQYPQAKFCLWLHSLGIYEQVKGKIEAGGKSFEKEINNIYVSKSIASALLEHDQSLGRDEASVRDALRKQFSPQTVDITSEDLLRICKESLKLVGKDGKMPCVLLILDEVQQYIGDSNERSVLVTEVAEAVSKQLESHVMVVGAGQSSLTDQPLLQRLMDRFTVRVPLSDTDVETVTRKVLLQKKSSAVTTINDLLQKHAGEISRQLQGTRLAERPEDKKTIVEDYPLLPVRRRFWENCFRQIDAAGTTSQLRSQLRIIHDAISKISDKDATTIIPGDELFDQLAPEMVNTGVLPREINERIIQLKQAKDELAYRIAGLVFLIGRIKQDGSSNIGLRSIKEHISDLMVTDLKEDNGKLRAKVEEKLSELVTQGVLMQIGDEYRLQTREGTEWDREFRNRQTKLRNDDATVQFFRDQILYANAGEIVKQVRVVQGAAKVARELVVFKDVTMPASQGGVIPLWIRDGWSAAEKDMVDAARNAGFTSPVVCVFIPRKSHEDLKRCIIEVEAAQQTLNALGHPTTQEGQDARHGMESRKARSEAELKNIAGEILEQAKVFQGGGNEVVALALQDKIRQAVEASLTRLFHRFGEGDSGSWEAVLRRVKEGGDHPFQALGHTDATERHIVCQQVMSSIGSGKTGTDLRKELKADPFGWPQDAIDAALMALHRSQHISATFNGSPVSIGGLDQIKISKTEFHIEQVTLSIQDRLKVRQLFTKLKISCKGGEEASKGNEFLIKLVGLAQVVGGDAPLPPKPDTRDIQNMMGLTGNEQLSAIRAKADELDSLVTKWTTLQELAEKRMPVWRQAESLAKHARVLPEAQEQATELDVVREQRLLLEPTDPIATIVKEFARQLRTEILECHKRHGELLQKAMTELKATPIWQKTSPDDQKSIISAVGLEALSEPQISTDDELISYLDAKPLTTLIAEIDAIPGRASQAIERAAKILEPKVQTVTLDRVTLRTEEDVVAWVEKQKSQLLEALKKGPVLLK